MKLILTILIFFLVAGPGAAAQTSESAGLPLQKGHPEFVRQLSWSPDDARLLSYSQDDDALCLWEPKTGRLLWAVNTVFIQDDLEYARLESFDWSPDLRSIASVSENGKVQLWDAATGKLIWMRETYRYKDIPYESPHDDPLVRFSPRGDQLITVTEPLGLAGEIRFWDTATGRSIRTFASKNVIAAAFSADGKLLKAGASNGEVAVWDVEKGTIVSTGKRFAPCGTIATAPETFGYTPDIKFFAGKCGNTWVITDVGTRRVKSTLKVRAHSFTDPGFVHSGELLAVRDLEDYVVIDLTTNKISRVPGRGSPLRFALSGDGKMIAMGFGHTEGIQVRGVNTKSPAVRIEAHPGVINSLVFSPDGRRIASGSGDRIVRLWDAGTGALVLAFPGHTDEVLHVEFVPNGELLISKSSKETITWDLRSGQKVSELKVAVKDSDKMPEKVVSEDKQRSLENPGYDKPFRLSTINNGGISIKEFSGPSQIQGFKFTPDGRQFLTAAYFYPLQLWDIEGGQVLREFDIGYSWDNAIAFSPDGKTFVTGGNNQNILRYDLETGKLLWSILPIDQVEMAANRAHEARRIRFLQDKADAAKRANAEMEMFAKNVYIEFDHYGEMTPPGELRMAESGKANKSKVVRSTNAANAVWLRLVNGSPLPIEVPTQSMYFSADPKCAFRFPKGARISGLCEDQMEIGVWLGLQDAAGKWLPFGFDFGASAILLPGRSVLFAVSRRVLVDGNKLVFDIKFQNETNDGKVGDYGTPKTLKFSESDLPK